MADEEQSKEDKTEAPSAGRLKQAHDEGNVPLGRDLVTVSGLAAGSIAILMLGSRLVDSLVHLVWTSLSRVGEGRPMDLIGLLTMPFAVMLGIAGLVAAAMVVATISQTAFGFWPQLALPNFSKVFGGGKLGRMFDKEKLADVGVNLVKIVTISAVLWTSLRDEFVTLPQMLTMGIDGLMAAMFGPIGKAMVKVLAALVVLAGADLALTRYRFTGRLKMTKEEVKREYKEEEGDPQFKGQRKRRHREILRGNFAAEVPKADVVVVNPTHIAVALRYRPGEDKAPKLTAKGKGIKAENIRDLAREHGIPIVQNVPLARLLYKKVKVGRSVPAETFKAVAAILAFVYKLTGKAGSASSSSEARL